MPIFNNDGTQGQATQTQITRGGGQGIFAGRSSTTSGTTSSGGAITPDTTVTIENEGTVITTDVNSINFVGSSVSATNSANDVTVTISDVVISGGAGISVNGNTVSIITGGVITAMLADGSVTTVKLADNSVTSAKIVTDAVTGDKIASGTIQTVHIENGAITTVKLADDAVTNGKIADSAVSTDQLATSSVTTAKINDAAVTTGKIVDDAITQEKLDSDSVGVEQIIDNSISNAKLQANSISQGKIQNNAIGRNEIQADAVGESELQDDAVTNAKIVNDFITINGSRVDLGQSVSIATGGNSGGTNPPVDQAPINISVSPRTLELAGSGTELITITVSTDPGFTLKANSTSATVRDTSNNPVTVSKVSNTSFTFSAEESRVGTYHVSVSGTAVRTSDDSEFVHTVTVAEPRIARGWYVGILSAQPDNFNNMTNIGVWAGSGERTENGTGGSNSLYFALPNHSGGYTFKSGVLFLGVTNLGTIQTNFTLYRIDDFDDSQSGAGLTVDITEGE